MLDAENSELMTKKDVADMFRVSIRHVERMIASGVLKKVPLKSRMVRLRRTDVMRIVEGGC